MEDEGSPLGPVQTWDSRAEHQQGPAYGLRGRRPTITIAEPEHRKRDELAEDAAAVGGTLDSLRLRKPRVFNRGQHRFHEDEEDTASHTPATRVKTLDTIRTFLTRDKEVDDMPYLSYNPTMGRNSNFVGLTLEQREELGGIEYRSLRTLALVILGYFWGFQILAFTCFLPWIRQRRHYSDIIKNDGQSPTWWAFWTSNSAFMDLGLTLTPDSMISFASSQYILMIMAFFIVIGNTGFPVMLRFLIWLGSKVTPKGSGLWEELRFLLDHPRRCFTLLFPSSPTWWLFWTLVILNVVDLVFFIVLDVSSFCSLSQQLGQSRELIFLDQRGSCHRTLRSHESRQRVVPVRIHAHCWFLECSTVGATPCHARVVHGHDVHFRLSHCYFYSQDQCLRRKVTWCLP